jgi:muramidase (phage lysozyme)
MNRSDLQRLLTDRRIRAFLKAIRLGEGTADAKGYSRLVGGGEFEGFADHPRKLVVLSPKLSSTAAGAFQFLAGTWAALVKQYGFPDFSPACQDEAATALLCEKGADKLILADRIEDAVSVVNTIWASLPGSPYGQRTVSIQQFMSAYGNAMDAGYSPVYDQPIVESKPVEKTVSQAVADVAVSAISIANPIVGAGLQMLRSLWPELAPLFKSGQSEVAARNTKAAEAVLAAVVEATGAPNVQAAVEAVQADPAIAQTARAASFSAMTDFGLVEVAGGISEARKVAASARVVALGLTFIEILALIMMLLSAAGGAWVLVDPLEKFGDQIRAMVITAMFIGGWTGIQAFFFGSSSASRGKDATIAAQAEKG